MIGYTMDDTRLKMLGPDRHAFIYKRFTMTKTVWDCRFAKVAS